MNGFLNGFSILYNGPKNRQSKSQNIPFVVGNRIEMWNKIMKEVKEKRVAGPFNTVPFSNYIQSPIGLVPKAGNQTRLIFHLSYCFSENEQSVNHHTPSDECSVKYNDLDHAVENCLLMRKKKQEEQELWNDDLTIFFSKTDLKSAFRILPLSAECYPWLIFKAVNPLNGETQYFVEKNLPFGHSISCALFSKVSDSLKHLIEFISGRRHIVTNYLDDFLFIAENRRIGNELVRKFLDMCNYIQFPVALEKTEWASSQMIFLGILLNGETMTLGIPVEKRDKAKVMIAHFIDKSKATVRELQVLCGYLNFLSKAIYPGRAFTRRMYSKYSFATWQRQGNTGVLKQYHHVRLDAEFKFDCKVWGQFLNMSNEVVVNRPMLDRWSYVTTQELCFYSDASANEFLGFGCIFDSRWIFSAWEPGYIKRYSPSIEYLELYGLCAGIFTWEYELRNVRIVVFCDNSSVVSMINSNSSTCKNCMTLIRLLTLNCLQFNRRLFAKHVPGKENSLSDALSRMMLKKFRRLAPHMAEFPEKISPKIYPPTKVWILWQ